MPLICTKCERAEAQREGDETHCRYCGNVVTDGVAARWPFEEREPVKQAAGGQILTENHCSPLQLAESIREKEVDMGKKECSIPGCEKVSWVDGLCHKHYTEKNGEYTPKKKYPPRIKKAAAQGRPEKKTDPAERKPGRSETKKFRSETKTPKGGLVNPNDLFVKIDFTDHKEMFENLGELARKQFRNVDAQILYIIDQHFTEPRRAASMIAALIGPLGKSNEDHLGAKDV